MQLLPAVAQASLYVLPGDMLEMKVKLIYKKIHDSERIFIHGQTKEQSIRPNPLSHYDKIRVLVGIMFVGERRMAFSKGSILPIGSVIDLSDKCCMLRILNFMDYICKAGKTQTQRRHYGFPHLERKNTDIVRNFLFFLL